MVKHSIFNASRRIAFTTYYRSVRWSYFNLIDTKISEGRQNCSESSWKFLANAWKSTDKVKGKNLIDVCSVPLEPFGYYCKLTLLPSVQSWIRKFQSRPSALASRAVKSNINKIKTTGSWIAKIENVSCFITISSWLHCLGVEGKSIEGQLNLFYIIIFMGASHTEFHTGNFINCKTNNFACISKFLITSK